MRKFPDSIQNAMASLSRLPGVGPKTALRYVFYLLKQPKTDLEILAKNIIDLTTNIKVCNTCYTYSEHDICEICCDQRRDRSIVCVVEESRDISTIESTDLYKGHYHVLGGILNPIEGMTTDTLRINELIKKIKLDNQIKEIILAFSPDIHGETTIMYLTKTIKPLNVKITRLARGLPIGASLEYADEITLGDALKGRHETV
ncbi:MAG: recombination mediator RecR [Patescibacteria group bacterium]